MVKWLHCLLSPHLLSLLFSLPHRASSLPPSFLSFSVPSLPFSFHPSLPSSSPQCLHERGEANADHTTLLLNCYTKLKAIDELDKFVAVSASRWLFHSSCSWKWFWISVLCLGLLYPCDSGYSRAYNCKVRPSPPSQSQFCQTLYVNLYSCVWVVFSRML